MKISIARLKEIILEEVARATTTEERGSESHEETQDYSAALHAAIKEELLKIEIVDDE